MKFALRQLLKSPGFTIVAVLTLALGIGANTAIFSVIDGVLLRPLPYDAPERLMNIWEAAPEKNFPKATLPPGNFFDLAAQNQTFAALAAWGPASLALSGEGVAPERLDGVEVSAGLLDVLHVAPARGRFFAAEEFEPGKDAVVVLSFPLWQQLFGGDPAALGRTLQLNGRPCTVIGIMPEGFAYPKTALVYLPFAPTPDFKQRRDWHMLRVIGRLKDGVSYEQARADLRRIHATLEAQFPDVVREWSIAAFPMRDDAVSNIRPTLLVLLAAVSALLLIACANVANLLLARAAGRRQEIAVRLSLGASRGRIVRQLLAENLLLFALGGAAGVLLALWGLGALLALAPPGTPRLDQVAIDRGVLWFTSAISIGTGLLFGLLPAWQSASTDLVPALRQGERGSSVARGPLRSALVVTQIAAAVALLTVAGLLLRSFEHVRNVNLGFTPERVLTFHLDLPPGKYDPDAKRAQFIHSVTDALAALPGVRSAGATTSVPMDGGPTYIMRFEGRPPVTPSTAPVAKQRVVTPDFFRTLGMTIVRGRGFTATDAPGSPRVCVINQALVRKYFAHEDPIGKRLEIGFDDPPAWREIVGIVADVKTDGLDAETPVQVFEPVHQWDAGNFTFAVRTDADLAPLGAAIRATVQRLDPTQPVHTIKPMTRIVADSLAPRTFSLVLLAVFAAIALLLAAIGVYGVVAYSVAQRTREFGVRLALGASAGDVIRLVLRQGLGLVALGIALGVLLAFIGAQVIESMLFGVSPRDPLTFASIALLLAGVALIACFVPARRATRVDPLTALRAE